MNKLEFKWQMVSSISHDDAHVRKYRTEHRGLTLCMEIYTPILADYGGPKEWGEAQRAWYMEEDKRTFEDYEEFLEAVRKEAEMYKPKSTKFVIRRKEEVKMVANALIDQYDLSFDKYDINIYKGRDKASILVELMEQFINEQNTSQNKEENKK